MCFIYACHGYGKIAESQFQGTEGVDNLNLKTKETIDTRDTRDQCLEQLREKVICVAANVLIIEHILTTGEEGTGKTPCHGMLLLPPSRAVI